MKLAHPLPTGRATDGYGKRGHVPGVGNLGDHLGQDWAAPSGTKIRAAAGGTVWANYFDKKGGWMVILKHSWGYTSYQHMRAKAKLKLGQWVPAGAHVGNVGSSGASNGPHLHFEVWLGGTPYRTGISVDPMTYFAPKPAPKPATQIKGTRVMKHYQRRDKTANGNMQKGRVLAPGKHLYLNEKNTNASSATNIVGGIGYYSITPHVYIKGTPGDKVTVKLIWQDTRAKNPGSTNSPHYQETIPVEFDGHSRRSVEFKRHVSKGYAVYVHLEAHGKNKGDIEVLLLASDAYLFG